MNDPAQKLNDMVRGMQVTASQLNQLGSKIMGNVVGGRGVVLRRMGDQVTIDVKAQRGTGTGVTWYTAETKAGLPDASTVPATSMARITGDGGTDVLKGAVLIVNPALDGWDAINFFEIS